MKSTSNWPTGVDFSSSNWSGRCDRNTNRIDPCHGYGAYEPGSERIPLSGWIGAVIVLALVFGYLPLLRWLID